MRGASPNRLRRLVLRLLALLLVVPGLVGLVVVAGRGWKDPELRRTARPVLRRLPGVRPLHVPFALPASQTGRLQLQRVRKRTPSRPGGFHVTRLAIGDFLGDGSTTVYQEFLNDDEVLLTSLEGDRLARYSLPEQFGGLLPSRLADTNLAVLPRSEGDLLLRANLRTLTFEAVRLEEDQPVWDVLITGSRGWPRGQLGTLGAANGDTVVWYADEDAGLLLMLDNAGRSIRETGFLIGTMFFTGDFDGDGAEELLALHPEEDSRLLDASGTVTARIRFQLPARETAVCALPARSPDGHPQVRLDFNARSPLYYRLDGTLAEAPVDAPPMLETRPHLRARDILAMGEGRHLIVSSDQITLTDVNGRTQDVLGGQGLNFMALWDDSQGHPHVAVFDSISWPHSVILVAVTAE